LKRRLAEEDNVRRIAKRDVDNARSYAVTGFAKSLLDVADDLERALQAVPKQDSNASGDSAAALKTLVEGVSMTQKTLQKAFTQHGVIRFGAEGEAFDPALHDALFSMPASGDKKSGTIGQVLKPGYKLKDRVIRPAQVGAIA
jgi:molecular chaperone GrpE